LLRALCAWGGADMGTTPPMPDAIGAAATAAAGAAVAATSKTPWRSSCEGGGTR